MAENDDNRSVGKTIQRIREERDLSQAEVARRLKAFGVPWTQGTLSRAENGDRAVKLVEAVPLANALEVEVSDLLPGRNLLVAAFNRARLVESDRKDTFKSAKSAYASIRTHRQSLQLLKELGEGSTRAYRVAGSPAYFLHNGLRDHEASWRNTSDLFISNEQVLTALGFPAEEIEAVQQQAEELTSKLVEDPDSEDLWGEYLSLLFEDQKVDRFEDRELNYYVYGDGREQYRATDDIALALAGRLVAQRFPNVEFEDGKVKRFEFIEEFYIEGLQPDLELDVDDA